MNHHNEDLVELRLPSENALRQTLKRTRAQSILRLVGAVALLSLFSTLFYVSTL